MGLDSVFKTHYGEGKPTYHRRNPADRRTSDTKDTHISIEECQETVSPFVCNHDGSCEEVRLCCTETEMTLTREDAKRIETLGYRKEDFLVRVMAGYCELKNVDGHCYFYDPDTKVCRIYENRPEGCKYYPIIYDARKRKCILDTDCPSSVTVTREEIKKVCHRVRQLVETLQQEAAHGESPC